MSTEIIYTNWFDHPISQQQLGMVKKYKKKTFVNGMLKMEEHNNIKFSSKIITYFLDLNENKGTIVSQYSNPLEKMSCTIYENKQVVNGFTVWDWEDYGSDGTLAFKGKAVLDSQNRQIMYCSFNLATNNLEGIVHKIFYDDSNSLGYENLVFNFWHELGGGYTVDDINQSTDEINAFTPNKFETWFPDFFTQHPYFENINPLIPTSSTI